MAIALFISYASADKPLFEKLEAHLLPLQRQGKLTYWHAGMTPAGVSWRQWRTERMAQSQLLVCLLSADYLAGMDEELQELLGRQAKGARIVPVLARPSLFEGSPLHELQPLPSNGRPVSQWSSPEDAWLDVAQGLWNLAVAMESQRSAPAARALGAAGALAAKPPGAHASLSSRKVRLLLGAVLRTDSDLEAFCLDFFPRVKRSFGGGMDRGQKITLLLDQEDLADIVKTLAEAEPALFAKHRHLLV